MLQKLLYCFRLKCFYLEMDTLDPQQKADACCNDKYCVINEWIWMLLHVHQGTEWWLSNVEQPNFQVES